VAPHGVEPEEVWEVCEDSLHLARCQGRNRYRLSKRAIRVAILPDVAEKLMQQARAQGVSVETLVNALLIELIRESAVAS